MLLRRVNPKLKFLVQRTQHNKSLDASGTSGLVIDNLSVT